MKIFLLCLAILTFPALAPAGELSCHVKAEEQGLNDDYDFQISGDQYIVRHYGHTRNNYAAVYELTLTSSTRTGWEGNLVKTHDDSTWKNMPGELKLKYIFANGFQDAPLYIIEGASDKAVWFGNSSCQANSFQLVDERGGSGCPVGQHPGHCPSRNCGSCMKIPFPFR